MEPARLVTQLSEADLARLLALRGDEDVIELGSGAGFYTDRIAALTTGTVYGLDIQPRDARVLPVAGPARQRAPHHRRRHPPGRPRGRQSGCGRAPSPPGTNRRRRRPRRPRPGAPPRRQAGGDRLAQGR